MIRIAWKEIRISMLFLLLAGLGLSVLYAILFVLYNFRVQMPDAYGERYGKEHRFLLESEREKLPALPLSDVLVYARKQGLTYDTAISYGENEQELPSYYGGVLFCSVGKHEDGFPALTSGEPFAPEEGAIWLSDVLSGALGCGIGDEIGLAGDFYSVKGVYDVASVPAHFKGIPSFILFRDFEKTDSADSWGVVAYDPETLLTLSKIDGGSLFGDEEGILELCRGYGTLETGVDGILVFLLLLLIVLTVCVIKMYFLRREDFFRILTRSGTSAFQLTGMTFTVFTAVSLFACSLAVGLSLIFNHLIFYWADTILNIIVDSPDYFLMWLTGTVFALVIAAVCLPVMQRNRVYRREVSNQ